MSSSVEWDSRCSQQWRFMGCDATYGSIATDVGGDNSRHTKALEVCPPGTCRDSTLTMLQPLPSRSSPGI
jgi:hypothetical protein